MVKIYGNFLSDLSKLTLLSLFFLGHFNTEYSITERCVGKKEYDTRIKLAKATINGSQFKFLVY